MRIKSWLERVTVGDYLRNKDGILVRKRLRKCLLRRRIKRWEANIKSNRKSIVRFQVLTAASMNMTCLLRCCAV
jgi:hypothetical protein